MSTVKLYGLKQCSTCVKAMRWLEQNKIPYEFTDYRAEPINPELLVIWSSELGGWEKLVNRASMTWRNLPEDRKLPTGNEQWLALISEFPAMIRRPVLQRSGAVVSVGFSEKKYGELLG